MLYDFSDGLASVGKLHVVHAQVNNPSCEVIGLSERLFSEFIVVALGCVHCGSLLLMWICIV